MIFGPLKLLLRLIGLVLTLAVLYFAVTFVQIWMTGQQHSTNHADVIMVFGTTEDNGTPSAELTSRLNEALALYDAHRAPFVAVTGGKLPGDVYTEAGVSATYLETHGVPRSAIILGGGHDTWQNVASVANALKSRHLRTVLTVTDPFHEYRAMAISSDQGFSPSPTPTTTSPITGSGLALNYFKETMEVGAARFVGYERLSRWLHAG